MTKPEIHFHRDTASGLQAFIALCGDGALPAIGGVRFQAYPDLISAASEAKALAETMHLKAQAHDLPLSGGKAMIVAPPGDFDRVALLSEFAQWINTFDGTYITAVDCGMGSDAMDILAAHTPYVTNATHQGGDPSAATALGVSKAIQAYLAVRWDRPLSGSRIAIQGVGKVGQHLAQLLAAQDCELVLADYDAQQLLVWQNRAKIVSPEALLREPCDVLVPCGASGTLNARAITQLACKAVISAANNALAVPEQTLLAAGIDYVPDYLANGGGLITCYAQYRGLPNDFIDRRLARIPELTLQYLRCHMSDEAFS
jgi:leucine dehydrogenase